MQHNGITLHSSGLSHITKQISGQQKDHAKPLMTVCMSVDECAHISLDEYADFMASFNICSRQLAVMRINVLNCILPKPAETNYSLQKVRKCKYFILSKSVLCGAVLCVCLYSQVCGKLTELIRAVSSHKHSPVQASGIRGFLCCCQADHVSFQEFCCSFCQFLLLFYVLVFLGGCV